VRDGGYVENTGLLTITDLLPALAAAVASWEPPSGAPDGDRRPRVDPVVLSIDDDPVASGGDPQLVTAPRRPLGISQRAGHRYLTRLARDRLTSGQYPGVRYLRLSPPPHVGAQAATGWELSETTREEDLEKALDDGCVRRTILQVRAILDGDQVPAGCR
jgi:hypothetical protein